MDTISVESSSLCKKKIRCEDEYIQGKRRGMEGKGRKDETQQTKEKGKGFVVDIIVVLLLPSHLSEWEGFLGLDPKQILDFSLLGDLGIWVANGH